MVPARHTAPSRSLGGHKYQLAPQHDDPPRQPEGKQGTPFDCIDINILIFWDLLDIATLCTFGGCTVNAVEEHVDKVAWTLITLVLACLGVFVTLFFGLRAKETQDTDLRRTYKTASLVYDLFQVAMYWWVQQHLEEAANIPRAVTFLTWFTSLVDAVIMKGPDVAEAIFKQFIGVPWSDAQSEQQPSQVEAHTQNDLQEEAAADAALQEAQRKQKEAEERRAAEAARAAEAQRKQMEAEERRAAEAAEAAEAQRKLQAELQRKEEEKRRMQEELRRREQEQRQAATEDPLKKFIDAAGLSGLAQLLKDQGIDTVHMLIGQEDADLRSFGVGIGHIKKLRAHANAMANRKFSRNFNNGVTYKQDGKEVTISAGSESTDSDLVACITEELPPGIDKLTFACGNSEEFTDTLFQELAKNIPSGLTNLTLYFMYNKNSTDAAIRELAKNIPSNLTVLELYFQDNVNITDAAIRELAKNMPSDLKELTLSFDNNKNFTDAAIRELLEAIPTGVSEPKLWFNDKYPSLKKFQKY